MVALTGHALAASGEGASGCDAFVIKPCLPDALVAEVKRVLAARSVEGAPMAGPGGKGEIAP